MRVMCAMSGGVDSSVAALLLKEAGHDVVGVTMKLWGGDSDTGCCSVSDVDDARRVAQQLDIDHLVFNFAEEFDEHVVDPYVAAHAAGQTPNPCIECNRAVKFARLAERADLLGFDAIATGHHARVGQTVDGRFTIERGADRAKDQSYVVHMLGQDQLARTMFPVGDLQKSEVRALASRIDLRTADKPDSQDVCFIMSTSGGRTTFLGDRIPFHRASVVDTAGDRLGEVEAVELVTVGQRKGLGLPGGGPKRYVVDVDVEQRVVVVGDDADLLRPTLDVHDVTWVDGDGGQRGRGARPVQRPRRPAAGDDPPHHRPKNAGIRSLSERFTTFFGWRGSGRCDAGGVGRAAAADRAGPERRVLRPRRHAGARRGDRRLISRRAESPDRQAATGGGRQRVARPARADEERREVDGAPVRFLRREGEHGRDGLGRLDLDGVTARRAGEVGRLRRIRGQSHPAHLVGPQRHRVGQHHGVVDHDPGRDEHEPATREPVPPRCEQDGPGDGHDGHHRAGDPRARRQEQRPGDDRRGPQHPGHRGRGAHRRGCTEQESLLVAVGRRLDERPSELGGEHDQQRRRPPARRTTGDRPATPRPRPRRSRPPRSRAHRPARW